MKNPFDYSEKGKIEISSKYSLSLNNAHQIYTPGVAEVVKKIAENPASVNELTWKNNTVAIVTDGTAVLGLGNQGPLAALPVMEGKAVIFKELAGINAVPILLSSKTPKEIIEVVKAIAPSFGGINLEDIAAPECFEITEALQKELDIPVFHDDQYGTAIVTLAALINACRATSRNPKNSKIIISGAGAAGIAITKLLIEYGVKDIMLFDSRGAIRKKRPGLTPVKKEIAEITNRELFKKTIKEALIGADVFIGVSKGGLLNQNDVNKMADNSIIFAMANPVPEIMPIDAKKAGAKVVATGRSDFPNQINNALVFPGIFKGALRSKKHSITKPMMIRAAEALSQTIQRPTANNILPKLTNKRAVEAIAGAVE